MDLLIAVLAVVFSVCGIPMIINIINGKRVQPDEEKEPKVNRLPQPHRNWFVEPEDYPIAHLLESHKAKPDRPLINHGGDQYYRRHQNSI